MGKDLRGKELGKGIIQEKTGQYMARFVDRYGKRQARRFDKLQDCRQWLADATYIDEHSNINVPANMTVDAWYEQWLSIKSQSVKMGTVINYKRVYENHIKPVLGGMILRDVRSIHCQLVLTKMGEHKRKNSTIKNVKEVMFNIFNYAYDSEIIISNPCKKSVKHNVGKESKPREALTKPEQQKLLEISRQYEYDLHYRFVLQTGARVGELSGFTWDDVDFQKKTIKVSQIAEYYAEQGGWIIDTPKTNNGIRTIPLTDEALRILYQQKEYRKTLPVIPIQWSNHIFLGEDGCPVRDNMYNSRLYSICKRAKIPKISMHILRHTFATRCIEAGMKPKTLQQLLGHASIAITMNLYVHTTDDEKRAEIDLVQHAL